MPAGLVSSIVHTTAERVAGCVLGALSPLTRQHSTAQCRGVPAEPHTRSCAGLDSGRPCQRIVLTAPKNGLKTVWPPLLACVPARSASDGCAAAQAGVCCGLGGSVKPPAAPSEAGGAHAAAAAACRSFGWPAPLLTPLLPALSCAACSSARVLASGVLASLGGTSCQKHGRASCTPRRSWSAHGVPWQGLVGGPQQAVWHGVVSLATQPPAAHKHTAHACPGHAAPPALQRGLMREAGAPARCPAGSGPGASLWRPRAARPGAAGAAPRPACPPAGS